MTVDRLRARRGLLGRAYMVTGKSGTGKTTIAELIAYEVANPMFIEALPAGELTVAKLIEKECESRFRPLQGEGRVYVVNEFHRLTLAAVAQFLDILERIPRHAAWMFTSTQDAKDWGEQSEDRAAFVSRCLRLPLTSQGLAKAFAARLREIAAAEGLDGRPESAYVSLVNRCRGNFREALQAIEAGEMLST